MTLMRESWILIGICLADLVVTLVFLADPGVREGNPLMKYYLDVGVGTFVLVKLVLVAMPLFVAEYSRQFKPTFVKSMLRLAIVTYVGVYVLLFAGVNLRPLAKHLVRSHSEMSAVADAGMARPPRTR